MKKTRMETAVTNHGADTSGREGVATVSTAVPMITVVVCLCCGHTCTKAPWPPVGLTTNLVSLSSSTLYRKYGWVILFVLTEWAGLALETDVRLVHTGTSNSPK